MQEKNTLFFYIFMFLAILMFVFWIILKKWDQHFYKNCIQQTKGAVIRYAWFNYIGLRLPVVSYTVNEQTYFRTFKYAWIANETSKEFPDKKYPRGTELDVYYDPKKPARSYVAPFIKDPTTKFIFLMGILFIVVALIGLLIL